MRQPEYLHTGVGFMAVLVPARSIDFDGGLSLGRGFEKSPIAGRAVTSRPEIEFFKIPQKMTFCVLLGIECC